MAIIKTIDLFDFIDAFRAFKRENHFSYKGLEVLFDYLNDSEFDFELDVIGLCCTYIELSLDELKDQYDIDFDDDDIDTVLSELNNNTTVIGHHYCEKKDQYYVIFEAY